MAKVYATVDCPYCNNPTNVRVRVMDGPDTKTVTCYKHGCEKDFLIRWHARVTVDIRAGKIDDAMQPMSPDKPPMRHVFHRFFPGDGMFNPLDSLPDAQGKEGATTMTGLIMDALENRPGRMKRGSITATQDLKDIEDIYDRLACPASELPPIERGEAASRSGNPFAAEWSRKALIGDGSED